MSARDADFERRIAHDVALAPRTTLGLGGNARRFFTAASEADVARALAWARDRSLLVTVLGGGSNVVVSDAGVDGLVVALALRGLELSGPSVVAAGGESFDDVVAASVAQGLSGLECLSGIPGLVGATPIQNVGAYGQEVAQTLTSVRALDRETLEAVEIDTADCGFAYRDSAFKRAPDRYVVLAVRFALRGSGPAEIDHVELARALEATSSTATPAEVRAAVLSLRRAKSMVLDPNDENRRSVGSFFVNPIVDEATAQRVVEIALREGHATHPGAVPRFALGKGRIKLAAGWLIEHAGLRKGTRHGRVGLSTRHALSLVHYGGGKSADLLTFARLVRDRVEVSFGIRLAPEPVFLGFGSDFVF